VTPSAISPGHLVKVVEKTRIINNRDVIPTFFSAKQNASTFQNRSPGHCAFVHAMTSLPPQADIRSAGNSNQTISGA
jgi:hypothetical protein